MGRNRLKQNQITGLSSSGDYLTGAALIHLRLVCNLRVFLDFQFLFKEQRAAVARKTLRSILYTSCISSWTKRLPFTFSHASVILLVCYLVQNAAQKPVLSSSHNAPVTSLFCKLHWLPIGPGCNSSTGYHL